MISRAERRAARTARVAARFDPGSVEAVLDLFETMEIAWHDLYGEITPAQPWSRMLASLEAVFGALYLAVFIASLMSSPAEKDR